MSKESEQYSEDEADRRFKEAIRRAVMTPPLTKLARPTKAASKPVKKRQKKA